MRRIDCHDRIKKVRLRYEAARQTIRVLREIADRQPDFLHGQGLDAADLQGIDSELHDIYFTRLFACFESCIRHYWRASVRDTKPMTEVLLSSVATRRGIPRDTLDTIHEIRNFRNYLIHDEREVVRRFSIDEPSRHLNAHLARLPLVW